MAGASIEATLELWASSLRDVKARMRPLFTQERVAASAGAFLDGLFGNEQRKTGWMRAQDLLNLRFPASSKSDFRVWQEDRAMTDLLWLSDDQLERIKPYFSLSHGVPRVDDHRVVSGIVFVIKNGLRWRDAPREYGPHKTL